MTSRSLRTAVGVLVAAVLPAVAGAQAVSAVNGTTYVTPGPVNETATGSSMTGMLVTARFTDNTTFSGAWGSLGAMVSGVADYGVILGGRVRVSHVDNDTYPDTPWLLEQLGTSRLSSLEFDGAPGATGFDRYTSTLFGTIPTIGTPGSGFGGDYDEYRFISNSSAVYRDRIAVGANAPVGDLYRRLTITFDGGNLPYNFATESRSIYFGLDTDRIGPSVVPEPSTYALMGTGLAGLLAAARRRKRAA